MLFAETVGKMHEGLTKRFGFGESDVQVLFGNESQDGDTEVIKSAGRATREDLEKSVASLRTNLQPNDALWVIVVGHSHYDGKHSWLNLPGSDVYQLEFAKLFAGINAAQQAFVITTPTSGFSIKPLSAKGRVVITANRNYANDTTRSNRTRSDETWPMVGGCNPAVSTDDVVRCRSNASGDGVADHSATVG